MNEHNEWNSNIRNLRIKHFRKIESANGGYNIYNFYVEDLTNDEILNVKINEQFLKTVINKLIDK